MDKAVESLWLSYRWRSVTRMAMVMDDETARAEVASPEEIRAAIGLALSRLGLTYEDLADQAARDEFVSERAPCLSG